MRGAHARLGAALAGNVLLLFSVACLAASVAYPWLNRRASSQRVESAIADVELLRTAAETFLGRENRWPRDDAAPGAIPTELQPVLPASSSFDRGRYHLDWERWDIVIRTTRPVDNASEDEDTDLALDSIARPQGPRTRGVGGITVLTSDVDLRAVLLRRFGPARSFVRDSTWTLVLGGEPFTAGT